MKRTSGMERKLVLYFLFVSFMVYWKFECSIRPCPNGKCVATKQAGIVLSGHMVSNMFYQIQSNKVSKWEMVSSTDNLRSCLITKHLPFGQGLGLFYIMDPGAFYVRGILTYILRYCCLRHVATLEHLCAIFWWMASRFIKFDDL